MDMDGVLTSRHVMQVQLDLDAFAGVSESGATHASSAPVFHVNLNRTRKYREREQYRSSCQEAIIFHAANYTDKSQTTRMRSGTAPPGAARIAKASPIRGTKLLRSEVKRICSGAQVFAIGKSQAHY